MTLTLTTFSALLTDLNNGARTSVFALRQRTMNLPFEGSTFPKRAMIQSVWNDNFPQWSRNGDLLMLRHAGKPR